MRTNNELRCEVRNRIRSFFADARVKLSTPDWEVEAAPLIKKYVMDPDIHPFFYEYTWKEAMIYVMDHGSFKLKFPENTIGILSDETGDHASYWLRLNFGPEEVSEKILDYFNRIKEMDDAQEAIVDAATEALQETTVEKALTRMPELQRFLP